MTELATRHAPVSVIVPCYRCAATIVRAVQSIRAQTVLPTEIVFVDDASSDGTGEALRGVAAELAGLLDTLILTLERNRGAASSRNAGWQAAHEKYIAFLDADASWHPQKLEIQCAFMDRHPAIALSGHGHVVSADPPAGPVSGQPEITAISFSNLLWRNQFITSSVMARRELPVRFQEGQRHMEDHRLWLEAAFAGHAIARLDTALAAHHKPAYGASGLSADLIAMEKAELANYCALYQRRAVGFLRFAALMLWSISKLARRLLIVGLRRRD